MLFPVRPHHVIKGRPQQHWTWRTEYLVFKQKVLLAIIDLLGGEK